MYQGTRCTHVPCSFQNTRTQYLHSEFARIHNIQQNSIHALLPTGGEHICIQVTGWVKIHPARTHVSSLFQCKEKYYSEPPYFSSQKTFSFTLFTPKHKHPCIIPNHKTNFCNEAFANVSIRQICHCTTFLTGACGVWTACETCENVSIFFISLLKCLNPI